MRSAPHLPSETSRPDPIIRHPRTGTAADVKPTQGRFRVFLSQLYSSVLDQIADRRLRDRIPSHLERIGMAAREYPADGWAAGAGGLRRRTLAQLKPLAKPSMTKLGISFGILATVFCLQANSQTIPGADRMHRYGAEGALGPALILIPVARRHSPDDPTSVEKAVATIRAQSPQADLRKVWNPSCRTSFPVMAA
jgi:hypothetical protein